jgi:hypothetical protein
MNGGPSKTAEAIVAVFVPPACREEVFGDMHEQYHSPLQYGLDALRTIPMVVLSRMRRTADPQVLLLQAFALYGSFLGAAWLKGGVGPLRLAIPAGIAMVGLMIEEAYSKPGARSLLRLVRGPMVGVGLALLSQAVFRAVPGWTMLYGCAMGLLLTSAVRMLFSPISEQLQGADSPGLWLKHAGGSGGSLQSIVRVVQGLAAIVALSIIQTWAADHFALPRLRVVTPMVVILFIAYQVLKRGL